MTTVLDEPTTPTQPRVRGAERLRTAMTALRVSLTAFGVRKTLTAQQRAQAAESFGADESSLSAGKKLIDVRHPKYRAVTAIRSHCVRYWRTVSLPFPEPGIRLIRHEDLNTVNLQMMTIKADLTEAVEELDRHYEELKTAARNRLGSLYQESDYPSTLVGLFDVQWDFPSVEPPPYLQRLAPELYQQECERVQARFDEAVQLAEQAFTEELTKLVDHLTERLTGEQDGKPKVFRDTAITNLTEFFERFQRLNIRSNEQLDELVEQAQGVVRGIQPQQLRENLDLRIQVGEQLGTVQQALDDLLVDRPRRNIIRKPR